MYALSTAVLGSWRHAHRSSIFLREFIIKPNLGFMFRLDGPAHPEKVVKHSLVIGAIETHSAKRRVVIGTIGCRGGRGDRGDGGVFLASGLLLNWLGFDSFIFDRGAGFGFDVAKAFVVISIEVGGNFRKVV